MQKIFELQKEVCPVNADLYLAFKIQTSLFICKMIVKKCYVTSGFFMLWISYRFQDWMVIFGSLLDLFVSCLVHVNEHSTSEFNAVWFISSWTLFMDFRIETIILSSINSNLILRIKDLKFLLILNFEMCCSSPAA